MHACGARQAEAVSVSASTPVADGPPSAGDRPKWASSEFGAIYEEHSRQIYYVALRFLGDPTQAEDATHDVFLKAYRKLGEFRGESAMRTWLYRITINHCKNLQQTWHQRNMVSNADNSLWETAVAAAESPLRVLEMTRIVIGDTHRERMARCPRLEGRQQFRDVDAFGVAVRLARRAMGGR